MPHPLSQKYPIPISQLCLVNTDVPAGVGAPLDTTTSTMALLHSILDSTLPYHGCTSLYKTLHFSTMAQLHSTRLYITLPWLNFPLLDSTLLYHGFSSLY